MPVRMYSFELLSKITCIIYACQGLEFVSRHNVSLSDSLLRINVISVKCSTLAYCTLCILG